MKIDFVWLRFSKSPTRHKYQVVEDRVVAGFLWFHYKYIENAGKLSPNRDRGLKAFKIRAVTKSDQIIYAATSHNQKLCATATGIIVQQIGARLNLSVLLHIFDQLWKRNVYLDYLYPTWRAQRSTKKYTSNKYFSRLKSSQRLTKMKLDRPSRREPPMPVSWPPKFVGHYGRKSSISSEWRKKENF